MIKVISALIAAMIATNMCSLQIGTQETTYTNPLNGKNAAFVGDSISYGTNYHGGYAKLIGEDNNMTVVNNSLGGATVARGVKWSADSDGYRPCIIDMTDNLGDDTDYIIMEGGVNDFWNHAPLGDLTEGFDGAYDESTFAGGLESMFDKVKENYPESKAGFVIIHDPFTYDAEAGFEPYYEMIKSVCDKWDIPYLDLYSQNNKENGVNVRDDEMRKTYFASNDRPDGDGCHPNELGYRTIYVEPMTEWMKTL